MKVLYSTPSATAAQSASQTLHKYNTNTIRCPKMQFYKARAKRVDSRCDFENIKWSAGSSGSCAGCSTVWGQHSGRHGCQQWQLEHETGTIKRCWVVERSWQVGWWGWSSLALGLFKGIQNMTGFSKKFSSWAVLPPSCIKLYHSIDLYSVLLGKPLTPGVRLLKTMTETVYIGIKVWCASSSQCSILFMICQFEDSAFQFCVKFLWTLFGLKTF